MPNWCFVTLTLQAPQKRLKEVLKAIGDGKRCIDFNRIIPEDLLNPEYQCDPQKEHLSPHEINPNFNWYRWHVDHWGTKWNACHTRKSGMQQGSYLHCKIVEISFDTAWSFPDPVMEALAKKFPDVHMNAMYHYEGDDDVIFYDWQPKEN